MPLKKNDKIVIVAAVVVIIVAGIGIFLYTSPSTPDVTVTPESGNTNTYEVQWTTQTASISEISESAGKKTPYEGTIAIPHGNLKKITFNMSWVDDKAFLGIFGLDTLSIEITAPDGSVVSDSAKSMRRTKAGNIEITFDNINDEPSTQPIAAKSMQDTQNQLTQEPYYSDKWVNEDFKIKVSVSVGEFLGRIRPRDRGNAFTVEIEYEYYTSIASQVVETTLNNDQGTDTSESHAIWGLFIPTGFYGRS